MMDKVPKKKSFEICNIAFHNDDPINAHLDNTGKTLVVLQPKSPLHYVVRPISESKSSTQSNLLMFFKRNR